MVGDRARGEMARKDDSAIAPSPSELLSVEGFGSFAQIALKFIALQNNLPRRPYIHTSSCRFPHRDRTLPFKFAIAIELRCRQSHSDQNAKYVS